MNAEQPYYTAKEELELLANWGNALYEQDPEFADIIVEAIVEAEFPQDLDAREEHSV